jgi:hypothetical protein
MLVGDMGLVEPAASGADPFVKNEMGDLHLNGGKLNALVGIKGAGDRKMSIAALASLGLHRNDNLRSEHD